MNKPSQLPFSSWLATLLLCLTILSGTSRAQEQEAIAAETENQTLAQFRGLREPAGAVYAMTNATSGNEIIVLLRDLNGYLNYPVHFPTGGNGTGGGLGNQGGVILSESHRWLLAVNAGSNSISVFEIKPFGLRFVGVSPSGGVRPVSLTIHDDELVYVVHDTSDNIVGFKMNSAGALTMIPGSVQPLSSSGTSPAQISFDRHGELLLVTEKATNRLSVFEVDRDGVASQRKTVNSAGQTPFGFAFGFRDQLFVSEAFGGAREASALTSYEIEDDNTLRVISRSVRTQQTAACWVVLSPDGRYAYVTNTGSDTITSYRVSCEGHLTRLQTIAANTGDGPIDLGISADGRFLYVTNRAGGSIGAYRLNPNGRLTPIHGGIDELPTSINGLVAR